MVAATKNMFTQMSAKAGIKNFGEEAIAAMFTEFKQLNDGAMPGSPVFGSVESNLLSIKEKRSTLEAVNLIKKKRCGKIKGRTCADGSKQKSYLKEGENISSPTVSTESLIATLVIDAMEKRDVAIFDVPVAYLHAEMPKDKRVLMKLRGIFVDIMCSVNSEYLPFVVIEKGEKVLYLRILQALYGCIGSALLWYDLYATTLKDLGFKINSCDRCVANKIINGKQCTLVWYVDDKKLSNVDPKVVDNILDILKGYFRDLVITRGSKHAFLGMNIKICEDKNIEIEMKDHFK